MNKIFKEHTLKDRDVLFNRISFWLLFLSGIVFVLPNTLGLSYKGVVPKEGDVAARDVIAPFAFDVEKHPDSLAYEIALARRSVPTILNFVPSISDSVIASFDTLWNVVVDIIRSKKMTEEQRVDSILHIWRNLTASEAEQLLLIPNLTDFYRTIRAGIRIIYSRGFVSSAVYEDEERSALFAVRQNGREKTQPAMAVLNDSSAVRELAMYFAEQFPKDDAKGKLALSIACNFLTPNLLLDKETTKQLRDSAEKKVSRVKLHISKDERIVARHQKVDHETYLKLRTLYNIQHGRSYSSKHWEWIIQVLNAIFSVLVLTGLYCEMLRRMHPSIWGSTRRMNLIFAALMFTALSANILTISGVSFYGVPVCFASAVTSHIYGGWLSFTTGLASLLFTLLGIGGDVPFCVASVIVCAIISFGAGKTVARRRFVSSVFVSAGIGSLVILLYSGLSLLLSQSVLVRSLEFLIATALSSVLAYFVLPLAERLTSDSSELSLADMTDVNSIILQKLAVEAPGTFHHSMLVGNMAAAAAEAIGASTVLAQAGGYYHDIGKLLHPEYFIENLEGEDDPHSHIPSLQSAEIISSHPANGAEMARTNGFPSPLVEIIEQHHGDSLVEFFYRRAVEENPSVSEKQFRYPGPKPRSVEAAIVMICDIVEAYFRSQGGVPDDPQRIMWKLVERKILDGQFDECEISIRQIKTILERVEPILKGVYHKRTPYPVDFLSEEYESTR